VKGNYFYGSTTPETGRGGPRWGQCSLYRLTPTDKFGDKTHYGKVKLLGSRHKISPIRGQSHRKSCSRARPLTR